MDCGYMRLLTHSFILCICILLPDLRDFWLIGSSCQRVYAIMNRPLRVVGIAFGIVMYAHCALTHGRSE